MPSPLEDYAQVESLAFAARDWPGDTDEDCVLREYAIPICLSAIGVPPRDWKLLAFRHLDVERRVLHVPKLARSLWAEREILIPEPLFETIRAVFPADYWGKHEVFLTHVEIQDEHNQQSLRNLRKIARAAGLDRDLTWEDIRATHRHWLEACGHHPHTIDLKTGRRPG